MQKILAHIRILLPHILFCGLIFLLNDISWANGVTGVGNNAGELKENSILDPGNGDFAESARKIFADIVDMIRPVLIGIALLSMLYVGYSWVVSMGNEEMHTEGRYRILLITCGLFAVYLAELLYTLATGNSYLEEGFARKVGTVSTSDPGGTFVESALNQCNYFFCPQNFWGNGTTVAVIKFFEISMIVTAVVIFTYSGFKLFMRGGNEDNIGMVKRRVIYGVIAIIGSGFVELLYRAVFFGGSLNATGLTAIIMKVANFAAFLAGPVAIIILIIGGYFYVFSAGNEEKADRGKRVVLYTFFATILLLLSYTFLIEIIKFQITY